MILLCCLGGSRIALAGQPLILVNDFHQVQAFDNSRQASPAVAERSKSASRWVERRFGDVPSNAVVYTINNNFATYYCRGTYREKIYYGVLYPFIGCYITDNLAVIRLDVYEVYTS